MWQLVSRLKRNARSDGLKIPEPPQPDLVWVEDARAGGIEMDDLLVLDPAIRDWVVGAPGPPVARPDGELSLLSMTRRCSRWCSS